MVGTVGTRDAQLEAERIRRAQEGDRGAFDALVTDSFGRIYSLLFRMVGNHEDAEDLAQECFVRAYRSLRFYRGDASFATWLYRIALHLARDHQRRGTRRSVVGKLSDEELEKVALPWRGPSEEVTRKELVDSLASAIQQLPHNLRAALVLRILEGLDYDEVARAMGVRPGTARTQVMKARRLLVRTMGPWLERWSR